MTINTKAAIDQQVKQLIASNGGISRYRRNKKAFQQKLLDLGANYAVCYNDKILINGLVIDVD